MREVDHAQHAVEDGEAEADQRVDAADDQAVDDADENQGFHLSEARPGPAADEVSVGVVSSQGM
jgi:hypothetical protein